MSLPAIFSPQQWAIIISGALHASAGLCFLLWFFNSRWWRAMVLDATGHPVAGDIMKGATFVLGCVLTVAVFVGELGFERVISSSLVLLIGSLFTYSGVLQNVKRLGKKDTAEANKPEINLTAKDSEVTIGPNSGTAPPPVDVQAVQAVLAATPTTAMPPPETKPRPYKRTTPPPAASSVGPTYNA